MFHLRHLDNKAIVFTQNRFENGYRRTMFRGKCKKVAFNPGFRGPGSRSL